MHHTHRTHSFRFTFAFWILFLSLLIGILIPHSVSAAAYVVSKTADTNDGICDADCSLREAITAANASAADDTITFGVNGTITLTSALPNIANNGSLTITGNGAANTIISGNNTVRVFYVDPNVNITMNNLSITNGFDGSVGAGVYLYTNSVAILNFVTFSGNTSGSYGGGITVDHATLDVRNSVFTNNSSVNYGGAIDIYIGNVTVINTTISGNTSDFGGGINNQGTATVINSTISGNSGNNGAGISGSPTLYNTIVANNTGTSGDCSNGPVTAQNSLIEDGTCGITNGVNGNLTGDPSLNADLTLSATSIAVNAGNNGLVPGGTTTDLAGNPRIQQITVDMGAYESVFGAPTPTPTNTPAFVPTAIANATAVPSDNRLCENLLQQTGGAMKGAMGFQNNQLGGTRGNTYCRPIVRDGSVITSLSEIGVQNIINLGVVQAIDIYGLLPNGVPVVHFETPVHICLRGTGEVFFLNASGASRTVDRLPVTVEGEYRCADVINAGTLVLVGSPSGVAEPTPMPATSTLLSGQCSITTLHSPLNLRSEPNTNAAVLAQLPYNLVLRATERVPGWYRVIYLDGQGWVNAEYVSAAGDCG